MVLDGNWGIPAGRIREFFAKPDVSESTDGFLFGDCRITLTPITGHFLGISQVPRTQVRMEGSTEDVQTIHRRFYLRFLSAGGWIQSMKVLLSLFFTFARIGLFTFGGGYAMISVIEHLCVEKKKWISDEELLEMTVIAESTPGPIAINCATFVGHKIAGISGAAAATFGMVLPSFLIIYLISIFLKNFLELTLVANAFRGTKIAVGLLILDAGLSMAKKAKKSPMTWTILISACVAMLGIHVLSLNISAISLMMTAAAISVLVFAIGDCRKKGGEG